MKILNLYCGIGGNRKRWPEGHHITGVELDPAIAKIYKDVFPNDEVIVTDAHQYLLEHFMEYDFIWSSPPCPSHSRVNKLFTTYGNNPLVFPDMKLYEEILLLQHHYGGKWCVENVIAYYKPLIEPFEINNHWFWANFLIRPIEKKCREHYGGIERLQWGKGFDLSDKKIAGKEKILRNCVEPETGLHIFNEAFKSDVQTLF